MIGPEVAVTPAGREHREAWLGLRMTLWPNASAIEHELDIDRQLDQPERYAGFIAICADGRACGLTEVSVRHDYVNGAQELPVAFLESVYVLPDLRRQGLAARLVAAAEAWGRAQGCREFASDTELTNLVSQAVHLSLGFEETERVVFFRKALQP